MTYRFKLHEPIARGVSRIGLEQIEAAAGQLSAPDGDAAVHNVRRCLKRLRALLRLVRPALPEAVYRREARAIAAIGRQFASARDHAVMRQTLGRLEDRFGALPNGLKDRLDKLLPKPLAHPRRRIGIKERRGALAALEKSKRFFARADGAGIRLNHVSEGLERTYRRAKRAFAECYDHPGDEAFHEWRKAVQQHWRHMQLLSKAWPDVLGGRASEAKELSRVLGEDHDLAVLLHFADQLPEDALSAAERNDLIRLCRSWQEELRQQARPRGARLFTEPAPDFSARVAHYWSQAEELAKLARAEDEGSVPQKPDRRRPRKVAASNRASQAATGRAKVRAGGPGR